MKRRSIVEILHNSLADKPHCNDRQGDLHHTSSRRMQPQSSSSHDSTQNEVRYKLIIDPSEDESITQLLFLFGILQRENTRTYMCSDFFGDGELQKVSIMLAITLLTISMYLSDKYHSCYQTFSHCRTHCGHESN